MGLRSAVLPALFLDDGESWLPGLAVTKRRGLGEPVSASVLPALFLFGAKGRKARDGLGFTPRSGGGSLKSGRAWWRSAIERGAKLGLFRIKVWKGLPQNQGVVEGLQGFESFLGFFGQLRFFAERYAMRRKIESRTEKL